MHCFNSVKVRTIFPTRSALPSSQKDDLPIQQQSKMVYKFQRQCAVDYIERTIQRLNVWVKQQIPRELLRRPQNVPEQDLAISDHLTDHYICKTNYLDDCFSVLYKTRAKQHLDFLEALAIMLYLPTLCRQSRQFDILCLEIWWK